MNLLALDPTIENSIIVATGAVAVAIVNVIGMILSKKRDDRNQAATKEAAALVAEKVEIAAKTAADKSEAVAKKVEAVKTALAENTESTVSADQKLDHLAKVVDEVAVNAEATQTVLKMRKKGTEP